MKIALIQLNDKAVYEGYRRNVTKRTPLGLAYVAAWYINQGHEVDIIDASLDDLNENQIVYETLRIDPELIGISCTTPLFMQLIKVTKLIKHLRPDKIIKIGGPHVTALPNESLQRSGADSICSGEVEKYDNLDYIPFPARHLLRCDDYVDYARGVLTPQTSVITSRGCVGRCGFCSAGGSKVRFRSVKNVISELEEIKYKYGIDNIVFYDDSFTMDKQRVIQLCKEMKRLELNYQVQLRLDQIDEEIMDWLVQSGCQQVGPGIESGNREILESIGKRETPEFMLEKCKMIKKYPVKMRCSFIMGWIDETEEQILETIELAKKIEADENAFSIATPYPGTRMWEVAMERGLVSADMDFSEFLYYHKVGCNLSRVFSERLLELHELAYKEMGNYALR